MIWCLKRSEKRPTEKDFADMKKEAEAWQLASIDALIKFENNN